MSRGSLLKDTAHLWMLGSALVVGGLGFIVLRGWMTPASYGEKGPYRAEALQQIAARPSVVPADSVCLECHSKVGEERAESLHKVVRCWHCHGLGTEHVREARLAAKTAGAKPPAESTICNSTSTGIPCDCSASFSPPVERRTLPLT